MNWSAAIAFYAIFSLAPVLIIVTVAAGHLWGEHTVRREILQQFEQLLGDAGTRPIASLIDNALPAGQGLPATVAGVVTLLIGSSAAFNALRNALNAVWNVGGARPSTFWDFVRGRVLAFAFVLCLAFLLIVSLVVSAALSGVGGWLRGHLPLPVALLQGIDFVISFSVLWLLFAIIFRWLPDVEISWKDVWIGSAATSLLFGLGKFAIGFYLGRSGIASAYGVAGSVVLLLLWVYYSANIFLLGAEFTQVYARRWGSHIRPAPGPQPTTEAASSSAISASEGFSPRSR